MDTRTSPFRDEHDSSARRPAEGTRVPRQKAFDAPTLTVCGSVNRITGGSDIFGDTR